MMRKLFVALLVGAVAVGMTAPAFAADLQFTGAYRVRFQFDNALPCFDRTPDDPAVAGTECDGHDFQTRFRPRFTVETDGGVRGVLWLEIGDVRFGDIPSGGDAGADGTNVETKWAYIDFPLPATPIRLRAGIQDIFTSKALVIDEDFSGLSLYGKLGEINAKGWWVRGNTTVSVDSQGKGARDLWGIDLNVSPMKDLNLNVYLMYDHDMESTVAGKAATGVWVGAAAAGKLQNIRWDLDFVYGSKETTVVGVDKVGYGVDGGIGTSLPGTPLDLEFRGWFFTGDEGNGGDNEGFPVPIEGSGGHEPGTQVWGGGGVIDIDSPADSPENTWGFGVIARWTATPALRLTGNVHYIGTVETGTAASPSRVGDTGGLFGVDAVGTEVGVRADYTIHRGLVFTLTVGHLFLGDDTSESGVSFDDVTKVAGVLNYGF
ncbi:MAG: hypothetical protein HYT86_00110 [candidate division NC10 bacterium]|nr:hypothetical protein [candidate division NC10 bacterium]